jgi:hypothetical protein
LLSNRRRLLDARQPRGLIHQSGLTAALGVVLLGQKLPQVPELR